MLDICEAANFSIDISKWKSRFFVAALMIRLQKQLVASHVSRRPPIPSCYHCAGGKFPSYRSSPAASWTLLQKGCKPIVSCSVCCSHGMRITYCNHQKQRTIAVMETAYNHNVEAFREEEYPMLKGQDCN
jgi:hypothetical protein